MRKACDIVMLSAGEALEIAREVNRANIELARIEPYIRNEAMDGKYELTLQPSKPYHPKTIEALKELGYKVDINVYGKYYYYYCIKWGEE